MKKHVLFVDDEPRILEGLRHRLRRQRNKWNMFFVDSGSKGLEVLGTESIDVIVSDMRMPKMDGATLLKRVQEEYPKVVRIALSGYAELESSLRAVSVAHQFLNKPCDLNVLENVIDRACKLQVLFEDEVVCQVVGKIKTLPSLPRIYSQLMSAMLNENVSNQEVARILKQDMAMCAKLLQIANSAFFRLSRVVSRIDDAVSYLGFNTIKQLALAIEVFDQSIANETRSGLSLDALQQHSMHVANISSGMFDDKQDREDAFVAGLLHDIGKLLLVMEIPDYFEKVFVSMREEGSSMYEAEKKLYGVTHAEIGAYLLSVWGLPYSIIECVANHHAPERVDQQGFDILAAIYVGNSLANEYFPLTIDGIEKKTVEIDNTYLEELGVAEKTPLWRELAQKQADAFSN